MGLVAEAFRMMSEHRSVGAKNHWGGAIAMPEARRITWRTIARAVAGGLIVLALSRTVLATPPEIVRFNRDIRPILSDNCFQCHGPDSAQRQADLRLDVEAVAKRNLDGTRRIAPGSPAESDLVRRITTADAEAHMPPARSGKKLSQPQIELIRRWIEQGAAWEPHWAFIPPQRPTVPSVRGAAWVRNPIDAFIAARLEAEGMAPSAEADRATLIRRVTLDVTGLPPTPFEVDRFLGDESPDAYERVVDRLLASPRYGERMAVRWADAARYADTSGYQTDGVRSMWRSRDRVIEAFNRNLPFDQFSIQQLAGDMLPGATLDEHIASGFNRNHRGNSEGGIIPEEFAVEYVVDRVDTTATVWLGLTLACARCHDHKFDPVTQREFYQMFAFFNNVPEKGRAIKVGNSPPFIKAPTRDQQQRLQSMEQQLAAAEAAYAALDGEISSREADWAASFASSVPKTSGVPAPPGSPVTAIDWAPHASLVAHFPLDERVADTTDPASLTCEGCASFGPGVIRQAAVFDGKSSGTAGDVANFGYFDKFTLSAWVFPRTDDGTILARMSEPPDAEGYSVQLSSGKLQVNLVKRWLDDALRVETSEPLTRERWHHVALTYDGSRVAGGVKIFVDAQPRPIKVLLDELNQSFNTEQPLQIGGGGTAPRFTGLIDELRVYNTALPAADLTLLATSESIDALVALRPQDRTPAQAAKLRGYFLDQQAPDPIRAARQRMAQLRQQKLDFEESFPTTMVMEEMSQPRETFMLAQGQYDKPGERVMPDVPGCLPRLPAGAPRDRLSLARWLVDPANPLTARVAVNRVWQSHFGAGIVKTADDFGAQGDAPSHGALLDWLAVEFVASGWDMKALTRWIVTSATYRQSSKVAPDILERDPENRLLAHGPRLRLPAEMIRDQALAVSGLLVEKFGGPSVIPYQPAGLWKELTSGADFVQDHGTELYRRSLYTFWKRTIAPPSMMTFDASGRKACSVRETAARTHHCKR